MAAVLKVLLVEDSEDDAFFFSRALRCSDRFRLVGRAQSAAEAIAYLSGEAGYACREEHPYPDLLVLDLKMAGGSGFDVLVWLRAQDHRPKVCVYSSSEQADDVHRAFELGADWYEGKGMDTATGTHLVRALETRFTASAS